MYRDRVRQQVVEAERSPVRFHLHEGRTSDLRKWLKPIVSRYLSPIAFNQRSASLVFADRGILCLDFLHQGLSSGAVALDFVDFLCSGTNVTTTSLPPLILFAVDSKDSSRWHVVLSQASWSFSFLSVATWSHLESTRHPAGSLIGRQWSGTIPGAVPLARGSNLRSPEVIEANCLSLSVPSHSTKEALPSSLQIEAFYVSTFHTRDFHLVLSLRTLSIFLCSGTNVTTT